MSSSGELRKDTETLEQVQRTETRIIKGLELETWPYKEGLHELRMFSLEKRRWRGDMITRLTYSKGYHLEEGRMLFLLGVEDRTCNNALKLGGGDWGDIRRICWGGLVREFSGKIGCPDFVGSPSLTVFKQSLDDYCQGCFRSFCMVKRIELDSL